MEVPGRGCSLLQFNLERHTLKNIGKLTDYPGNMYCKPVNGEVAGHIILSCGYDVNQVLLWDIATGEKKMLGKPGCSLREVTADYICLDNGKNLEYYRKDNFEFVKSAPYVDASIFGEWADSCVKYIGTLSNGKIAGVRGQEYFVTEDVDKVPEFIRIPGEAPTTTIMTITNGNDGKIWGSTALGQTIFNYDITTGEFWNSPQICNNGGEVYGMCFIEDSLYMSAYVGGDHVVYDPSKPWDQYNNVNPETLKTVAPELIRPTGKSIIGPDGNFWTGWSAKYGTYGGGLSRIDAKSKEMTYWYDPVPNQQIAGLTCDDRYLYFTTNGEASGREDKVEPFNLCVWDLEGKITWRQVFESGVNLGVVLAADGYLFVSAGNEVWIYETGSMKVLHKIPTGIRCTFFLRLNDGVVAAFCGDKLITIELETGSSEVAAKLPGIVGQAGLGMAVIAADGNIYFAAEEKLYKFIGNDSSAFKSDVKVV